MIEHNVPLQDIFRAAGRRLTSQRRLVFQVLAESCEHLDVETIYQRASCCDAEISLATVYRTLAVLKEMGLVEEHTLGEEHSHYEAVHGKQHYHFICLGCGRVIEFGSPYVAQIERDLAKRYGVQITNTHLRVSGICPQCVTDRDNQTSSGGQSSHEA